VPPWDAAPSVAGPLEVPTVGLPSVYDDDGAEREGDEEDEALVRCHGSRTHATRVGPPLLLVGRGDGTPLP
jgi:hypothetical protein